MTSNPSPKVRARQRARIAFKQREKRYPIWSARAILGIGLIAVVLATILTLWIGQHRLLVELELTLGIVAVGLFLFLTTGLYLGARVRKNEPLVGELKLVDPGVGNLDVGGGIGDIAGAADDPLGCLFAIVAGVLISIVAVVLMLLFVNLAAVFFFLFMLAVGWIFHRALRNVFAKSKRCRGDILASIAYAGMYTVLYTGWLLAILLAVDWFRSRG
jgi:small-conductance mechanosensitive channel